MSDKNLRISPRQDPPQALSAKQGERAADSAISQRAPRSRSTGRRVLINTGALASSSLWRIGLSFVLQLLIASQLGLEGLGQYATAMAYLNVSQVLSELGLPQLLMRDLAQFPGQRRATFWRALLLQVSAAIGIWLFLFGITSFPIFGETTRLALLTVTASLPFYALSSVCITFFQADERMEVVMGVEVLINALIVVGSIGLLFAGATIVHLTSLLIGTQLVSCLIYSVLLRRSDIFASPVTGEPAAGPLSIASQPSLSLRGLWQKARPFYGLAIANVLLYRLDLLLLSAVSGELITGIYSAAYLVVRVFLILGQAFWQALYPTLSRLKQQTETSYERLAGLGIRYGLLALLPAVAAISGLAEPILRLILPVDSYEASVPVLRLLIWSVPLFFFTAYAINLLLIERRPQQAILVAGVQIGSVVVLLPLLVQVGGALGAGIGILCSVVVSSLWGGRLLHQWQIPVGLPPRFAGLFGIATGIAVTLYWLLLVGESSWWPLYGLLGMVLYSGVAWLAGFFSPNDLHLFRSALERTEK